MDGIHKYVRTPHIRGSRFQHGDHDMEAVSWEELDGKPLIIEEKIDGANSGISFSSDGELLLQSRGHYLRGGPRERHFNLLKQWAGVHQDRLFDVLEDRYVMYGEWMFAKHTFFYDALPHYFMEFDVLDTKTGDFLSTDRRRELLSKCPIESVKVIASGDFRGVEELAGLITRSNFITDQRFANLIDAAMKSTPTPTAAADVLKHTDMDERMEGLYVKWEEDGIVKGRYKYVRETFTSSILDQEQHWHARPIVQNHLIPGSFERMFDIT